MSDMDFTQFHKDQYYDVEAMFNLRDWLQNLLEKEGCEITGTGLGGGFADIVFKHQGAEFFVQIKPRMKS